MCGIIGYIGPKAPQKAVSGLKSLEYRGYDSAGVAWIDNCEIAILKTKGAVKNLDALVTNKVASVAIGHTRWATHGEPSERNAHPHIVGDYAIVHNGIIENYKVLSRNFIMSSETDSEVIAHLLNSFDGNILEKINGLKSVLEGKYSIVIMDIKNPDSLYGLKDGAPLLAANAKVGAALSSDVEGLIGTCTEAVALRDGEIVEVKSGSMIVHRENPQDPSFIISVPREVEEKSVNGDYMLKEILEQPNVVQNAFSNTGKKTFYMGQRTYITACGTSLYAGEIATSLMEDLGHYARVKAASEFRYRPGSVDKRATLIAISQSGETADTIAAAKEAREKGASILSVINRPNSTLSRISNDVVDIGAGPEISVASTKAFLGQLAVIYKMLQNRGNSSLLRELENLPSLISNVLSEANQNQIKKIAQDLFIKDEQTSAFFIGRGYGYPTAKEGALKLKEISYIHAEAYPAGELKHGPIALLKYNFPVIAIATGSMYEKMISSVLEVKSRGAKVFLITDRETVEESVDHIVNIQAVEECLHPFLIVPILQLLAYYTAILKGYNVDRPRNLAKSVTVE